MKFYRMAITLVLAVALFAASLAALGQMSANAQNTACYARQGGATMVAGSGCTYLFESGSNLQQQPTALAVSDGDTIESAGILQVTLTAAATATLTSTGYTAGDFIRLVNVTTHTLTIPDSDPAKLSSAASLGEYDTADFWFDGTYWIQTGESNN
jgi:hypothetical protein